MVKCREIEAGESHLAHAAMRELRPDVGTVEEFAARVDTELRPEGYRLVGTFTEGQEGTDPADVRAVAGFRIGHSLALGRHLYVDDLVTLASDRGAGHGRALLDWLREEARGRGCGHLHLDSATHRHGAHRFYLSNGMHISAFHFLEGR